MNALQSLLDQPLVHRLGWTLVHFVWQGTVIALLAGILLRALRHSSNARYTIGIATLLIMVAAPVFTLMTVCVDDAVTAATGVRPPVHHGVNHVHHGIRGGPMKPSVRREALSDEGGPRQAAANLSDELVTATPFPSRATVSFSRLALLLPWLVATWMAGVLFLSVRLASGWWFVQRLKHRGTKPAPELWQRTLRQLSERLRMRQSVKLLQSALVHVPTVVGCIRPVILLPASALTGLTRNQLEALLIHELAHIRRHDYLVNLLQSIVETLLFYHPAVWWLSRRIRIERENCCDDMAVRVVGNRLEYAQALAQMAEIGSQPVKLAAAANGGDLLTRIRRLVDGRAMRPQTPSIWAGGAISLLLGCLVVLAIAINVEPTSATAQPPETPRATGGDAHANGVKDSKDQDVKATTVRRVEGHVVDQDGAAVAGADVWLPIHFNDPKRTAHAQTDSEGRFELQVPESWIDPIKSKNLWDAWAHAKDHSIGATSAQQALFSKMSGHTLRITLGKKTDTSFVVLAPDEKPLPGATVRPVHFRTPTGFSIVPEVLASRISAKTDMAGRAKLPAMPREGFYRVEVKSDQFGTQHLRLDYKATAAAERRINLRPVGRIEGRIVGEDPKWRRGVRIHFETERRIRAQDLTQGTSMVVSDEEGKFVIPAIAQGKVRIMEGLEASLPVRMRLPESVELGTGETKQIRLQLVPGVPVSGQVRVAGTGRPVVGARVSLRYGQSLQGDDAVTDKNGRFQARVLPGQVYQHVIAIPPEADAVQSGAPWNERFEVLAGDEEFKLPTIELVPVVYIPGSLIDQEGAPVVGARVSGVMSNRRYGFSETDKKGQFKLRMPAGLAIESYTVFVGDRPYRPTVESADPLQLRVTIARDEE